MLLAQLSNFTEDSASETREIIQDIYISLLILVVVLNFSFVIRSRIIAKKLKKKEEASKRFAVIREKQKVRMI